MFEIQARIWPPCTVVLSGRNTRRAQRQRIRADLLRDPERPNLRHFLERSDTPQPAALTLTAAEYLSLPVIQAGEYHRAAALWAHSATSMYSEGNATLYPDGLGGLPR